MSASEKRARDSEAGEGRRDLHGAVDETVESVLDAADEEILADFGDERGDQALGGELLRDRMLDVLGRYYDRLGRSAAPASAKEAS